MKSAICTLILFSLALVSAAAQPTYSREVSRIMQQKCQMCHRPGDVAPFPLLSYDDAMAHAGSTHAAR